MSDNRRELMAVGTARGITSFQVVTAGPSQQFAKALCVEGPFGRGDAQMHVGSQLNTFFRARPANLVQTIVSCVH